MAKSLNQLCNLAVQNMTTFVNRSILCQIAPNVIENFQSLRREGPKSPFCLPSLLPLRCIGSRWNPVIIKLKDPLYPLRYHLSRLIQGIGSYLKTTTGCRTRYLKSSGLQSSQILDMENICFLDLRSSAHFQVNGNCSLGFNSFGRVNCSAFIT